MSDDAMSLSAEEYFMRYVRPGRVDGVTLHNTPPERDSWVRDALYDVAVAREPAEPMKLAPHDPTAAFEVRDPATGHAWRIYEDGRIDGFPPGVCISNGIIALVLKARAEGCRDGRAEAGQATLNARISAMRAFYEGVQWEPGQIVPVEPGQPGEQQIWERQSTAPEQPPVPKEYQPDSFVGSNTADIWDAVTGVAQRK